MSQNTNYMVQIQQNGVVVNAPMPDSFSFDTEASYDAALPQGFTNNTFIKLAGAALGTRLAVQALTAQLWQGNSSADLGITLEFHTETDPIADVRTPIVNLLNMSMPSINSSTGLLSSPGPSLDLSGLWQVAKDAASDVGNSVGSVLSAGGTVLNGLAGSFSNSLGVPNVQWTKINNTNTSTPDGTNANIAASIQQNPQLGTAAYWKSQVKNPISIQIGNYLLFDSVVIVSVQQTFSSNFDSITGLPHHASVQVRFKPLFMLVQQDLNNLFINPGGNGSTPNSNPGVSIPASQVGAAFGF